MPRPSRGPPTSDPLASVAGSAVGGARVVVVSATVVSVESGKGIVDAITGSYDLPLGAIAPFRREHPIFRLLDDDMMDRSTKDGTLLMLLNAGPFHAAITRLSHANRVALFGSSANISMSGTKFSSDDIEPEIRAIADVTIDYGLMKYHPYRASSTLLNLETLEVVRHGSCYEDIRDIVRRYFHHDPGPRPAA